MKMTKGPLLDLKITMPINNEQLSFQGKTSLLPSFRSRIAKNSDLSRETSGNNLNIDFIQNQIPPIHGRKIFMFATLPFDDVGGGQRSAQLSRTFADAGFTVYYLYAFKKYDFSEGKTVDSVVNYPRIVHIFLDDVQPEEFVLQTASSNDVAIFEAPVDRMLPWLIAAKNKRIQTVFDLIDDWETSLGLGWFSKENFDSFVALADRVVGSARELVKKLTAMGRHDAEYIPNAANDKIFDHYKNLVRPSDAPNGPYFLYFGSLYGEWFCWESIRCAAQIVPATIVLIGDSPKREIAPNVLFLGPKQITELPAYLQHAEAALLPFVPGKISDSVSPIKIFEYISLAKNVISNNLPEIFGYPNVSIANSPENFGDLCLQAFGKKPDIFEAERFLIENTWANRCSQMLCDHRNLNVSVIVLCHNNRSIMPRVLESLDVHVTKRGAEVIVVDNNSDDGSADFIKANYPWVKLLRNPLNGCSSGRNLGVKHAKHNLICFLDSDQWLTSSLCFDEAIAILKSNASLSAVGWAAGWIDPLLDNFGGPILEHFVARGEKSAQYIHLGYRTDVHYLGSGGLFTTRDAFLKVGGFDEQFDPTCFEDTDFSMSLKRYVGPIAYRNLTGIRHQAHQTTSANTGSQVYSKQFLRNSKMFGSKWDWFLRSLDPVPSI